MRSPPPHIGLLLLGGAALFAGSFAADSQPAGPSPYLIDLHLHGSLSERAGTMANHVNEAVAAGYDGLWWTDHMERTFSAAFVHRVRFEGNLDGEPRAGGALPNGSFTLAESAPGISALNFRSDNPLEGSSYARLEVNTESGADWSTASLDYGSRQLTHRISLFAAPHLRVHLRTRRAQGETGAIVRAVFSSKPDGISREGIPFVLEYFAPESVLPPPGENTVRVPVVGLPEHGWGEADLDLAADAFAAWPSGPDLGLRDLSIVLHARQGGERELDLDDFRMELEGATDLDLLRAQRDFVRQNYSQSLFHEVGMEIAGPDDPLDEADADHLISLFPGDIPELLYLTAGSQQSLDYPQSGVDWIQSRGGVAILAHVFGPVLPPEEVSPAVASERAQRILAARAWGADAVEVGYPLRGRPLAAHVQVWDELSAARVYVTGVGVSDNHTVQPWPLFTNRMGSWLRAPSSAAPDLCAAVKAGDVFFGDAHLFSPTGDFLLDEAGEAFRMGDVVPTAPRTVFFRARVTGARPGDFFVMLHNGAEIGRGSGFTGTGGQAVMPIAIEAGDWVRVEIRGPGEQPILFANPIYFVGPGEQIPPHRRP